MKVLFYTSTELGEDNILWGLIELGIDTEKSKLVVEPEEIVPGQVEAVAAESGEYDLVISRNFYLNVAEGCHISGVPYIAWCYDSPVMNLYSKEALYPEVYVFAFDRNHMRRLKDMGLSHVYYQPLAANMVKAEMVSITEADLREFACDVSFVGGMYKSTMYERFIKGVPESISGECENLFERHLCRWDGSTIFSELSDEAIEAFFKRVDKTDRERLNIDNRYLTEMLVLVNELTSRERFETINRIGKRYNMVLNTRRPEEVKGMLNADVRPPLDQLSDKLFKTYAAAKINLNITMRSIESGVPQRVFDIMSVGGCVFSNYQEEAAELFEQDKEIVLYRSLDELMDKIDYYIKHEKDRLSLCINGYKRVKECYNYPNALKNMIEKV